MTLTTQEVDAFLLKFRKRGATTLSILGKHKDFINAIDTDFGKQFLTEMISEYELLLGKIASIEATPEEISDYRAIRKILLRYSEKISAYYEGIDAIKQTVKGEVK